MLQILYVQVKIYMVTVHVLTSVMLSTAYLCKQVACSLCSETMEREILAIHKGENCPQRIVTCEFCEFPLPAIDLAEHQEVCGNRTELCHLCSRYIRLRERYNHESRCTGIAENNVGSSRDVRETEREEGAPRRQRPDYSRRRILFTIAITGIAVLLGSLFFQKKADSIQVTESFS
ncbi:TRAF-type zinc finger-related family protein [Hibiscus syriacus]|uniref:TRAF-type zinc finger-related family protein n=1 Tax=Hibiscus syriacus TaxID=106335 RepID=A0A6A3CPW1_HIBSY|nr:TRAF-type zinc finger-related family protein [Hibiscus syriacus]